ncbi:MAG: hypothetical protein AABX33_02105 [Nanoarchaeota archaeon]
MNEIKKSNKSEFIGRIERELLSTLINYTVPFFHKKISIKTAQKEKGRVAKNLENILADQKPKIRFNDIKELEFLLMGILSGNIKSSKSSGITSRDFVYTLTLKRQKTANEKTKNYSFSIKYEENQDEERLKVSIKKSGKEVYSAGTSNKKELRDGIIPYSTTLSYEDNYAEERLSITFRQQLKGYMRQLIESKDDMTNRVPLKWLNILPESLMGGILGFTYLGENFMGRRADLTGKTARMVDIHESIHTPDEYETRILTSWIMEKSKSKYVR